MLECAGCLWTVWAVFSVWGMYVCYVRGVWISMYAVYAMYALCTGSRSFDVLQLGNHDDNSTHPPHRTSLLPRPVLTLRAPNLALLEQTLPPPLTPRRIHIP